MEVLGFQVTGAVVTLGVLTGLTYGVLGVGLVLVYRTNRIVNFAHAELGVFGAAVFGLATTRGGVPYYLAVPIALVVPAIAGAAAEAAVVRRLRNAPRLMSIVATLGVGQLLLLVSLVVNEQAIAGAVYPQPPGLPVFDIGALRVTPAYSGMLLFTPLVVLALVLFFSRTRYGLAIRAAAANPELARMRGVSASRVSSLAWAIAGALSGFTALLYIPSLGFVSPHAVGPSMLLRALTAAVLARMTSMPRALLAGVGVGVVEHALLWNYPRGGLVEASLFVIILLALLLQRRTGAREEEKGSWAAVRGWRPLPEAFRQVRSIRLVPVAAAVGALAAVAALPLFITHSVAWVLVSLCAFTIVGLSVGVISGLGGQLSLGQFALAGAGATASFYVSIRTGNFLLAFVSAGLAGAAASLIIGLPALRIRGLLLAVTTLSFALVTPAWLLEQPWMLGEGVESGRPIIAGTALDTGKSYYLFALLVLVVALWLARNVRNSGIGRRLVAVRDNEDNARAFTVRATAVKVQSFALSGFIAGLGGALFSHGLSQTGPEAFSLQANIDVVAMALVGGVGVLLGPLVGALYIIGVPAFIPLDTAGVAAAALGWLLLILYAPGGIAQLLEPVRDRIADALARRAGLDATRVRHEQKATDPDIEQPGHLAWTGAPGGDEEATVSQAGRAPVPVGEVALRTEDLAKHYGGIRAVDAVTLDVVAGETVGLIGPNGAGKTTLFELLAGFTRPDHGRVLYGGRDIGHLGPERRAALGLIRSFQDAALFPTMTVLDTVRLALEKTQPTPFFASALGLRASEAKKDRRAHELVGTFGLSTYRDKTIQELSTGTRRITELACLFALEPAVLLLDEPSSGIAQRETEALGSLLGEVKEQLGATLVVIEHDIPLIMGIADRVVAMDTGRVIAEGPPDTVRRDPDVTRAYLGGRPESIQRSGAPGGVGT